MKIAIILSGQGGFDGIEGPFEVPQDVYEEGQTVAHLEETGELELGACQGAEVVTADDLRLMVKQANETLKLLGGK